MVGVLSRKGPANVYYRSGQWALKARPLGIRLWTLIFASSTVCL